MSELFASLRSATCVRGQSASVKSSARLPSSECQWPGGSFGRAKSPDMIQSRARVQHEMWHAHGPAAASSPSTHRIGHEPNSGLRQTTLHFTLRERLSYACRALLLLHTVFIRNILYSIWIFALLILDTICIVLYSINCICMADLWNVQTMS